MEYYERLRNLREDKDLRQQDIAELLGTTQTYYSKYERGIHPIPVYHLKKLCEYYNVSADYILGLPKGLKYPE